MLLQAYKYAIGYYLLSIALLASVSLFNHRAFTLILSSRVAEAEEPRTRSGTKGLSCSNICAYSPLRQSHLAEFDTKDGYPISLIPPSRHPRNAAFTMEESVHYSLNSTLEWDSLIPAGTGGAVRLGPDDRFYTVSMFHQLQCLNDLRKAVVQTEDESEPTKERVHHCLNYVRQMLLCAASVRLEPVKPTAGGRGADGFWLEHRCKDWTLLRQEVELNHGRWRTEKGVEIS